MSNSGEYSIAEQPSNMSLNPEAEKTTRNDFWIRSDGRLALQYYRPTQSVYFPDHTHSEYNLVICLTGSIAVNQLGSSVVLGPGEATVGNVGQVHSSQYSVKNNYCEAVSLMIKPRLLVRTCAELNLLTGLNEAEALFTGKIQSKRLHAGACDVAEEYHAPNIGKALVLESIAIRMLIEMLRSWPTDKIERQGSVAQSALPRWQFVRAFEFMHAAKKDGFGVDNVAREVGSSPTRFSRLFAASTSASPAVYFNEIILQRGRCLLENPTKAVKEIAFDLGFRSDSHFCASFRNRFGVSPSKYRSTFIASKYKL